jgi:hypothetical protein
VINITAMSSVNVVRLSAQFFAIPILSRLLTPDEYGIMGMAMPFTVLAMTLVDGGIRMSLVRTSSAEWKAWSTCFWLTMFLGLGGNRLPLGDHESVGGDAQRGVVMKASPSAAFEMPEPDLLLELLIVALDPPA